MARLISILVAAVVLLSAAAEIASFVIDHKSWLQQNYEALRSYVPSYEQTAQPPAKDDDQACSPAQPEPSQQKCEDIEAVSKRILCLITLHKAERTEAGNCETKPKPGPRHPTQGDTASAAPLN